MAFAIWWHSARVNRKENFRIYITIVNKNLGSGSDLTMHNNNATCWIYSELFGWLLLVTRDSWRSRRLSPITLDGLHCLLLPAKAFSVANIACTVPTAPQLSAYVRCDRRGDKGRARACTCLPRRRLISACDAMNWKRTLASPAHIMLGKNCLTSIKCAPSYYYVSPPGYWGTKSCRDTWQIRVEPVHMKWRSLKSQQLRLLSTLPVKQLMTVTGINGEERVNEDILTGISARKS